jgi:YidC/Oxa1 family membrane protein insertase
MNFLGMDLALTPSQALKTGLLIALPYFLLLAIMLVTGIVQNRQLQARNTSGNVNPQQQAIMKFMPFFLPVFSFGFPAGLALYWCTQNLCRIGTNHYITKSVYAKEHEARAAATPAKGSSKDASSAKGSSKDASDPRGNGKGGGSTSGSAKAGGGRSAPAGTAGSKPTKAEPSGPGKSVKSQKAHEKATGQRGSGSSSASGSRRRSGERRSGPRTGKDV